MNVLDRIKKDEPRHVILRAVPGWCGEHLVTAIQMHFNNVGMVILNEIGPDMFELSAEVNEASQAAVANWAAGWIAGYSFDVAA